MRPFLDLPLKRKLTLIVLLAILVALTSAMTVVLAYFYDQEKQNLSEELEALASITAQRSTAAIMFVDKKAVLQNLDSLMIKTSIETACVFKKDQTLFAAIDRVYQDNPRCAEAGIVTGVSFVEDKIIATHVVELKGRAIGTLMIHSTLAPIHQAVFRFVIVSFLAIFMAFALAYLVTAKLTTLIAAPISQLTQLTRKIRRTGDYALRGEVYSKDETGQLVQHFNDMVSKIQLAEMQMDQLVSELKERSDSNEAHAQDMSQRHDAIRDFFSGVTHDLRQPLQAIDMYVNVLQGEQDLQQREALYQKLHLAVSNLGDMFRELLDVSRFEAKLEQAIHQEPVALEQLLEGLCHEFDALAGDKGLTFKLHLRNAEVLSDATMLSRVIRNLVSNAIRYTETGGLLVAVRPREQEVWVEVWDTGRGIPENKQAEIFAQFSQVKSEDAQQGYGLGLSIVKRLVDALGHTLELKSQESKGTCFRLRMARVPASEESQEMIVSGDAAAPIQLDIPGTADRVMLVDDDSMVLDAISQLLSSWSFKVVAFSSAEQAIQWVENTLAEDDDLDPPVLIISDFHLGGSMNGVELLNALGQTLEGIPAFIISSTDDEADIQMIKNADYQRLPKPIKPAKLRALINYHLTQSR